MTIDIWYALGHLCEAALFLYYANTSFLPRKSYLKSSIDVLCGYLLLFLVGIFGNAAVSISSFFMVNIVLLVCCYGIKINSAVFYSLILDMMSCLGEYMIIYFLGGRYFPNGSITALSEYQSFSLTVYGKILYFIGIIFLKHFTSGESVKYEESQIALSFIPIVTIVCLSIMMCMEMKSEIFLTVCISFFIINVVAFYLNARLIGKNKELKILRENDRKIQSKLAEYQILEEKYKNTQVMRHDFDKHLDVLRELIDANDTEAKNYLKQLSFNQNELNYARYTDNNILNILLTKRIKMCHERDIEIQIQSTGVRMGFISGIDTVAIFSNLVDNAIEAVAQEKEEEKRKIFIDMYEVNNSFSVVKVENYSSKEPIVVDGLIQTQKENADFHGIGIKSINNALANYGNKLEWSYDKERNFFTAIVMLHIPNYDV